jgi:hypothetical protein
MGNKQQAQPPRVSDRIPLNEWDSHFKERGHFYKTGPVMERNCTDVCCVVTFFVLLLGFIALGGYFINGYTSYNAQIQAANPGTSTNLPGFTNVNNGPFAGICVGMICLSVILSIGFVMLAKTFPKCMVWGLIVFSVLLFVAVAIAGFIIGNIALGVVFVIITLIYALILFCCLRGHIDTSIILVKCTGSFLTAKPQVYLIGIIVGIITAGFSIYWVFGYIGILTLSANMVPPFTGNAPTAFQVVFWILYLFFVYFFYFATVFLVGACVALWYYKNENVSMLGTAIKSITFGSILITIIRVIRTIVSENSSNPALRLCFCIIMCILRSLEYYLRILNHYATISMSFTGQGYIASAKNAGLLIFNNMGLFATVDIISACFFFVAVIVCIGIPTGISAILINLVPGGASLVVYMVITVLLSSLIIAMTFITIFTDSLSAIFLFYCMDKKLTEYGFTQSYCPDDIK